MHKPNILREVYRPLHKRHIIQYSCTAVPPFSTRSPPRPYLLHGAGDHAPHVTSPASLHGVRLPRPGLAVAEKAHVETVERRLDELGDLREHFLLPGAVIIRIIIKNKDSTKVHVSKLRQSDELGDLREHFPPARPALFCFDDPNQARKKKRDNGGIS